MTISAENLSKDQLIELVAGLTLYHRWIEPALAWLQSTYWLWLGLLLLCSAPVIFKLALRRDLLTKLTSKQTERVLLTALYLGTILGLTGIVAPTAVAAIAESSKDQSARNYMASHRRDPSALGRLLGLPENFVTSLIDAAPPSNSDRYWEELLRVFAAAQRFYEIVGDHNVDDDIVAAAKNAAKMAAGNGDLPRASAALKRALELNDAMIGAIDAVRRGLVDGRVDLHLALANAELMQGNYATAAQHLAEALNDKSPDPEYWKPVLLRQAANIDLTRGHYDAALRKIDEALNLLSLRVDRRAFEISGDILHNLAVVELRLGRFTHARDHAEAALIMWDFHAGISDIKRAEGLKTLAVTWLFLSRPDQALAPQRAALRLLKPHAEGARASWLRSLMVLADILSAHGCQQTAASLHQQMLAQQRAMDASAWPEISATLTRYGTVLLRLKDYGMANNALHEAYAAGDAFYGQRPHLAIADINNRLGLVAMAQENFDEAFYLLEDARRDRIKLTSASHPDVINSLNNLGKLDFKRGKILNSLTTLRAADQACDANANCQSRPGHRARIKTNLALTTAQHLGPSDAEKLLAEAQAIYRGLDGALAWQQQDGLVQYAELLAELGYDEQSQTYQNQATQLQTAIDQRCREIKSALWPANQIGLSGLTP